MKNILWLFFLLVACKDNGENNPTSETTHTSPQKSKAIIIIDSKMDIPIMIAQVPSFDNFLNPPIISSKTRDTLHLKIEDKDLITISHKEMFADSIFISPGDTLVLGFSKDYSLNKKLLNEKKYTYKRETAKQKNHDNVKKRQVDSITRDFYSYDYDNPLELYGEYDKIVLHQLIPNKNSTGKIAEYKKLIDLRISLFHENGFSHNSQGIDAALARQELFHDLINLYGLSKNSKMLYISTRDEFINENTRYYPFGRSYLYYAIYDIYFKHLQDNSRSRISYDQHKIFDSLPRYFDSTLVKFGRMICLQEMAEEGGSFEDTSDYFDRFDSLYNDSLFKKHYQDHYLTDLKKRYSSKSNVSLMNVSREVSSLSDVIGELKDNIIYIDFWASWCAPCRDAMPSSRKLRSEYKDVKFIFLSIDKNSKAWVNASSVEGFEHYEYNYLLLNKNESNLMRDLRINTIPRYLLYDKKGELVHQNAPGPDSKEIRKLLDKYLEE